MLQLVGNTQSLIFFGVLLALLLACLVAVGQELSNSGDDTLQDIAEVVALLHQLNSLVASPQALAASISPLPYPSSGLIRVRQPPSVSTSLHEVP